MHVGFRGLGGCTAPSAQCARAKLTEPKTMDRGQRPEMPRSHPRSMDHTRGSSNLMPRSRREGLLNHGVGGWGLLGASPRKTRAPKRGALEIDLLGRGSPKL